MGNDDVDGMYNLNGQDAGAVYDGNCMDPYRQPNPPIPPSSAGNGPNPMSMPMYRYPYGVMPMGAPRMPYGGQMM